jgi:hypothetical protein
MRRGIVHLRPRRSPDGRRRAVDASPRWRAGPQRSRWAAPFRHPWGVACADVQPLTWKEQTVVPCGSP